MTDINSMEPPQGLPGSTQVIPNMPGTPAMQQGMGDIHDIESPIQVGIDPFIIKILIGTALLLLIALLLFYLFRYFRNRMRKQGGRSMLLLPPPLPPGEVALRELDLIIDLMQSHPRLYYFRLTALLKTFIGKCFNIHAPEMTTQEMIAALNTLSRSYPSHRSIFASVRELFDRSSMVKYAAVMPSIEQMKGDESCSRIFVDAVIHKIIDSDNKSMDSDNGNGIGEPGKKYEKYEEKKGRT